MSAISYAVASIVFAIAFANSGLTRWPEAFAGGFCLGLAVASALYDRQRQHRS